MTEELKKALEAAKTEEEKKAVAEIQKLSEEELDKVAGGYFNCLDLGGKCHRPRWKPLIVILAEPLSGVLFILKGELQFRVFRTISKIWSSPPFYVSDHLDSYHPTSSGIPHISGSTAITKPNCKMEGSFSDCLKCGACGRLFKNGYLVEWVRLGNWVQ